MDRLSGIAAFVRATESRSFAAAARTLGMTPSGVGKSIARLEAELGVRLLHRTTRRLSLTDDGAIFFERCRGLLDDLDDAQRQVSSRGAAPRGRLRLSLPSTLARQLVIPALPSFVRRHPDVQLEIGLDDRRVSLAAEAVDVALRIGPLEDSSLVARPLWRQQVITIAPPGLMAGPPLTELGDLAGLPCLSFRLPSTGRERVWQFRAGDRDLDWHPRALLTVDEGEALVAAVTAGLGVAQVPSYMAADALAAGQVVEVLAALRPRPAPISAVYASSRNLASRIRVFVDWLATLRLPPPPTRASPRRSAGVPARPLSGRPPRARQRGA